MAAAAAVFDTAELLETILLQLPMRDIVRAQCVDRTFRDTIKESPSLQRALFLKPCVDFAATFTDWQFYATKDCTSREDCDLAPVARLMRRKGAPYEYFRTTSGEKCNVLCNPLLPRFTHVGMRVVSVWVYQLPDTSQAKGRWEDMLLTQPPLQRALVYTPGSNHNHMLHSDEGAAGITIGCLQRFLKRFGGPASSHAYIWCHEHRVTIPEESTAAEVLVAIEDAVQAK
ncbi:hypothetical protein CBER1_08272 [Cercospora berteroae]|uniref:F-box domain-containing protein n=1 Tax=Cercospora berteroae TaxID=357750 RepID=A0A2S6CEV7_9PEZI|nr:hypothetical protein CBER1_08272 [Cercospora berteroae]